MTIPSLIERIVSFSDSRAIQHWQEMGIKREYLGANLTNLKLIAKEIKKNQDISDQLWAQDYHDCKLLACLCAEPKKFDYDKINEWAKELYFWDLADKFAQYIVAKSQYADKFIHKNYKSTDEYIARAAYACIAELAKKKDFKTYNYNEYFDFIEQGYSSNMDIVKDGANSALLPIGALDESFRTRALQLIDEKGVVRIHFRGTCFSLDVKKHLSAKK
jgi:3-methyladenine DNA glycosylase AlkD